MNVQISIITSLYRLFLNREPRPNELKYWGEKCVDLDSIPILLRDFAKSKEFLEKNGVVPGHPAGHYYSPVVDPATLDPALLRANRASLQSAPAIDLNIEHQKALWQQIASASLSFPSNSTPGRRFYLDNPVYSYGDAVVLCGMISHLKPRRIIEIGSGFSSACMLDQIEISSLSTEITFIDPYPERLIALLTEGDLSKYKLISKNLQEVPLETFDALQEGDILFIDSTHVMKAGSDVNYELFEILPRIRNGVYIHFHDTFWPFEYPEGWIFNRGYSWNELYGLRAFLQYNKNFTMEFFSDAFFMLCHQEVDRAPEPARSYFLRSPGGAMWLRKAAD
ncbi:MAG TPA: class I SAM-dependent methyltransferase [Stellaceae bacterium]|jgi:predicted O-methyltransferase YrrM|nr:class I SAM-dependent methyltransferase [Stellaceae bacterium]